MTITDKLKFELEQQLRDPLTHCYGISSINKIKEILALIEKLEADHFAGVSKMDSEETELNSLAFLEELGYTCVPPSEVKEVAEAANANAEKEQEREPEEVKPLIIRHCIAGAFWQKAQDHDACRSCEKSRDAVFQKGMQYAKEEFDKLNGENMYHISREDLEHLQDLAHQAGKEDMLEQMKKEAVECEIEWYDGLYPNLTQEQFNSMLDKIGAKAGDTVKLLILPADENNN